MGKEIVHKHDTLLFMLKKERPEEIHLISNWLRYIFRADREVIEEIENTREVKEMFATALKKYGEELSQQAMQQGVAQGVAQGVQQGINTTRRDVITRMLKKNFAIGQIAELTGASIEEIKDVAQEK